MPLLRSGVLCYTIAKPPEQFRCGETPIPAARDFPRRGKQGRGRWGATPYRCFAEPLRRGADPLQSKTPLFPSSDLPCFSILCLRSSIPSQHVPKLCHADAGRFYATAPLCISLTSQCNSRASQCRCNMLLFLCCVLPSLCYAKATPDRSIGVQSPYDDSPCKAVTMLFSAIALPHYDLHCRCDIRRWRGKTGDVRRYGGLPQSRRLAAATAPSEREPGIRGSGRRWGWRRRQNGEKRYPGACRFGWC